MELNSLAKMERRGKFLKITRKVTAKERGEKEGVPGPGAGC